MAAVSVKRSIRRFHVVVVQWTSKKCTKKHDARAELLFWSLNLLFFVEVVLVVDVVVVASVTFNNGSTASASERSQQNLAEKHDKLSTWWYYKWYTSAPRRLWIPDPRYWIPDSFSVELSFQIPIFSRILDPWSLIPDSKAKDSWFHQQKFTAFRNPYYQARKGCVHYIPVPLTDLTSRRILRHKCRFQHWSSIYTAFTR